MREIQRQGVQGEPTTTLQQPLRTHFSFIRAAIVPLSFASSSTGAADGDACSAAARMADSPPKASAFPFIVLSMLMNPLLRLGAEQRYDEESMRS